MAELTNPLREDIDEDVKGLFNRMAYHNFNGVEREVEFVGQGEVKVEHGLGHAPDISKLTVRVHIAFADIGLVWVTRVDERYVFVKASRPGKARLEITHPPARGQ
jgi:hypothetical protein